MTRKVEIALTIICSLIMVWMAASFFEVVLKQMSGNYSYSAINFMVLLKEVVCR